MSVALELKVRHTPEDLLTLPDGKGLELVDGDLVELNVSALTGLVGLRIAGRLMAYCDAREFAWVFPAETGYRCFPGRPNMVRKPDASLILRDRLEPAKLATGWLPIAPDLAVEVISPHDNAEDLEDKIVEYLNAGVRLVWIVFPRTRSINIRRINRTDSHLAENDELTGEDVVPGFSVKVADLFPPTSAAE